MNFDLMFSRDHEADPPRAAPTAHFRALADVFVGGFLFIATAAFVFWQNAHLTVLWDLSYILENATRISLGQLPYRDFPFPYAPGTFLVQAAIIKLFGRVVFHHYIYVAITAALASVITWRILLRLLVSSRLPVRPTAFLLAAPLIFLGTSSILPLPFYDSDCTLFLLFCVWLLLHLESANFPSAATFGCGFLLAIPPFIKQNTGLAFLLSAVFCIAYLGVFSLGFRNSGFRNSGICSPQNFNRRASALLLAGAATGFGCALALIQSTVGLRNYYHWTIQFAASRRLPGLGTMLSVYQDSALVWMFFVFALGIALFLLRFTAHQGFRWLAAALLSLPFLWALAALYLQEDAADRVEALLHLWPLLLIASLALALWRLPRAKTLAQLVPFILLGAIHGAFLSQQLWGSTYALWPMLLILLASILVALAPCEPASGFTNDETENFFASGAKNRNPRGSAFPLLVFAALASLVLLITGSYYALSHERLDYVDLSGDTLRHSNLRALRGLAMRGSWLPDFEELVAYAGREIPRGDAILMLPGEDLFYFTTGRTPQFPVVMLDNTVNPYGAVQLVQLVSQRNVRWLVIKRRLQLQEEPLSFRPQLLELLSHDFDFAESLNNYDIYRRKPD